MSLSGGSDVSDLVNTDMLDDFSAVKIEHKEPEISAAGPGMPSTTPAAAPKEKTATGEDDVLSDDDFAKQLQAGMAELMGEMESSPEMQAQFESIFKELGAAAAATGEPSSSGPSPGTGASGNPQASSSSGADASFQDTIRRTMERMQTSGDQATAAAQSEGSDDFMAELLKQMQGGGLGEGGVEGSEEEFSKMLLGMMEQLTNKDILYEPMKELNDKFPGWMEKNKDTVSEEDRKRYELQQGFAKEIVAKFEESTYSDSNAADREYIVDKMQKMQAAGSPPADLVGDMPSAQDALNAPDAESCNPQ
ncbi:hypothetical protein diail_4358 [Diaporthe ilicicola]|nr:hypothetical protein diail_4358 [Diaporthe ilicicola]